MPELRVEKPLEAECGDVVFPAGRVCLHVLVDPGHVGGAAGAGIEDAQSAHVLQPGGVRRVDEIDEVGFAGPEFDGDVGRGAGEIEYHFVQVRQRAAHRVHHPVVRIAGEDEFLLLAGERFQDERADADQLGRRRIGVVETFHAVATGGALNERAGQHDDFGQDGFQGMQRLRAAAPDALGIEFLELELLVGDFEVSAQGRFDVGVADVVERGHHVVGGERRSVAEEHVAAQVDGEYLGVLVAVKAGGQTRFEGVGDGIVPVKGRGELFRDQRRDAILSQNRIEGQGWMKDADPQEFGRDARLAVGDLVLRVLFRPDSRQIAERVATGQHQQEAARHGQRGQQTQGFTHNSLCPGFQTETLQLL